MRTVLKKAAESALCRSGLTRLAALSRVGDTIVLAYHNIVPEGEAVCGDTSLHLPQREFARQLDLIRRTHEIVPLATLLQPRTGPARRPRAVITFDDACQGAVTAGVAELVSRGLPATVFVAPAFLGGRSFWWDALSGSRGEGLPAEIRTHALDALAGRDDDVRAWAGREQLPLRSIPEHQTCATEEQLRALDRLEGITLGSHTWSHPNLTRLSDAELEGELLRPLSWLSERFRQVIPWLAYPYGLASDRVRKAAAAAGYEGAVLVEGGWLGRPPLTEIDPFALPRQNIPAGLSLDGFELRVSGLRGG